MNNADMKFGNSEKTPYGRAKKDGDWRTIGADGRLLEHKKTGARIYLNGNKWETVSKKKAG
jgi:hypothetical protein